MEPYGIRNVLFSLLSTIDPSEALYWPLALTLFSFLVAAAFVVTALKPETGLSRFLAGRGAFYAIAAVFTFSLRWPSLLVFPQNPDESFCIAAAMKLLVDPVYWRSFVGMTHGPLIHYPLVIPGLFGFSIDYAAARIIGIGMFLGAFYLTEKTISLFFPAFIARLAVIPGITTLALFSFWDYRSYNGEHVVVLLLCLASYLGCRLAKCAQLTPTYCLAVGVVLGLVPFAKIQAAPQSAFIAAIVALVVLRRFRPLSSSSLKCLTALTAGGLAPTLFVLVAAYLAGTFEQFWISYILHNISYSTRHTVTFLGKLTSYVRSFYGEGINEIVPFFVGQVAAVLVCALVLLFKVKRLERRSLLPVLISSVFLLVSAFTVVTPGNNFFHYVLLLVPPAILTSGLLLGTALPCLASRFQKAALLLAFLGVACLGPMRSMTVLREPSAATIGQFAPSINESGAARVIRSLARPGDQALVWGWADYLYVQTGLTPATRYTVDFTHQAVSPRDYSGESRHGLVAINGTILKTELIWPHSIDKNKGFLLSEVGEVVV